MTKRRVQRSVGRADLDAGEVVKLSDRELQLNVIKHAQTNMARVTMHRLDNQQLQVVVQDGGVGLASGYVNARCYEIVRCLLNPSWRRHYKRSCRPKVDRRIVDLPNCDWSNPRPTVSCGDVAGTWPELFTSRRALAPVPVGVAPTGR
jgi:hypothetical protein